MQRLVAEYQRWQDYYPIVRLTLFHGEFVKIYPLIDGYGRTPILILNIELIKNVYPSIIIIIKD